MSKHMTPAETLFDNNIRIDRIVWIAGATEGFDDRDFFEDVILEAKDGAEHLHSSMSIFRDLPDWVTDDESFVEWAVQRGVLGFVVHVCTPKPVAFNGDAYISYGFGMTSGTGIYVEDIADVVPLAVAWREERMKVWRKQAEAA